MGKKVLLFILLGFLCLPVFGQNLYELPSFWDAYSIHNYGVNDGIYSQQVYSIHPDKDGFVWLITNRQLLKFDGLQFFDKKKGNVGGTLYDALEDDEGILWISSIGAGLYQFNGDSLISLADKTGDLVKDLEQIDSTLYLGMYGAGLKVFDGDTVVQQFTKEQGLVGDEIWVLEKDKKNRLWIGTNSGLSIFENGLFTNFTTENGLPYNNIRSITFLENGQVWVGTDKEGIVIFENYKPTQYLTVKDGLTSGFINTVYQLKDKSLLVGTTGGGLLHYDGEKLDPIDQSRGLISSSINAIYEDDYGTLFIGSEDGLSVLVPNLFQSISLDGKTIFNEEAVTLNEDSTRTLWLGTYGKGYRFWDGNRWQSAEDPPKQTNGYAQSGTLDKDGNIWVGTQGSGVFTFNNNEFEKVYTTQNGLLDDYVRGLVFDDSGNLWVGSNKGITVYDNNRDILNTYGDEELSSSFCITMLKGTDGSIWYGSFGGGVVRFNKDQQTIYNTQKGLRSNQVLSIFEDSNNNVWIGTFNYGISKVVGDSLVTFGPESGLPEGANVAGMLEDDQKRLWLATGNGVIRVEIEAFTAYEEGRIAKIPYYFYTREDGLISDNLQAGNNATVLKRSDGRLFFASIDGVSVINPTSRIERKADFEPYITDFLVDKSPLSNLSEIEIDPTSVKLEISYSALNFTNPAKTAFRVKLYGVDKDWVEMGTRTTTYYDYLPDGDYIFEVSAIGPDGQWSDKTASLEFTVLPPFYKTWWFIGLCFIGFASLSAGGVYWRSNQKLKALNRELEMQQKIQLERERISRELHDNVGSQISNLITGIEISNLHVKNNQQDQALSLLDNLDNDARGAMTDLRETIWLLDKEKVEFGIFLDHLNGYLKRQQRYLKELKVEVSSSVNPQLILSPDRSLNLTRIVQEALNNTNKYAKASVFSITCSERNGKVRIVLKDDGIGMDAEAQIGSGNGLVNMHERAKMMDAAILIESKQGKGTTITLEFT